MTAVRRLVARSSVLIALLAFAAAVPTAQAQEERLTLDWLFSDEGKQARAVPNQAWLDNGALVIYDDTLAKAERTLELVNPANGRRRDLVDAVDAIESLTALTKPEKPIEELGWPAAFSPDGRFAAYEKTSGLFLLDTRGSSFTAIAESAEKAEAPRFSPDGKWLAYVADNDLYVRSLEDGDVKRLTSDGSETVLNGSLSWVYWEELFGRSNRGYSWSPDSTSIAYLQSDESMVGVMNYVHFKPQLPELKEQRHPKPGTANPRVRAGVVRIDDAETTWLDLGAYPYEYLVRYDWLDNSEQLLVQTLNRPQTDLDLFLVDASGGAPKHVLRESNEGWVNVHDDLHVLDDGERFLWLSERDGFAHLYLYSLDGELIRQVTQGDWALREAARVDGNARSLAHVDAENELVYFTALEKDSTERHLYRVGLDGNGMQRLTSQDGLHTIRFSPDGRYYTDSSSAIDRAPSLTVHHPDGVLTASIHDAGNVLQRRFDLVTPEIFSIRARDGYEMPAMMTKPRFFDPERQYPVVTFVYSGPSAPQVVNRAPGGTRDFFHQMLADRGVIVFTVDNRSAAGRSKTDANTILEQLYGPVELNDLLDGIAWLKSQPYVDPDRVGIWGGSGGGTMTMSAMTGSEEFVAGVSVAGVTDWHYYDTIYTERYMKTPQANPEGYESTSLVRKAKDLHGRLLLVHGTYDDNVHPQNAWAFSDALIEAGIQFDMMIYPMRKHSFGDDAAQQHLYETMLEFWKRELELGDRAGE